MEHVKHSDLHNYLEQDEKNSCHCNICKVSWTHDPFTQTNEI